MLRIIVQLRSLYKYFSQNKTWILSVLFICSIIRASLWYALFGINILSYSTLQDLFMNFAEYFMSFIFIGLSYILFLFIIGNEKSKKRIFFSVLIFIFLFCIYNIIFRMIVSALTFFGIIIMLSYLYKEKKIAVLIGNIFLLLFLFTLVQPFEQFFLLAPKKNHGEKYINTSFKEKPANYDMFSFEYSNKTIQTDSEQYYYIGGNSNYYFILDRNLKEVMIIPKSECSNIKGTPLSFKKISKMFGY